MFRLSFKKVADDLRFAFNLDDHDPQHFIGEPKIEQAFPDRKEHSDEKAKFSYITGLFLKASSLLETKSASDSCKRKQSLFGEIVGHEDLKKLLAKCLDIEDSCNILLSGPPASSKTVFMMSIQKEVSNACFIDAANASGPGLVDYLFEHPETHVICIDELDKLKKSDEILSSTKARKTRSIKMEGAKVFATSNSVDKLIGPLRSRFLELELPEYTWENFLAISQRLLRNRYGLDEIISEKIAQVVWSQLKTRDIRDFLTTAKLTKVSEDVEFIAATLQKYKKRDHQNDR
jgi:hypothetical protein